MFHLKYCVVLKKGVVIWCEKGVMNTEKSCLLSLLLIHRRKKRKARLIRRHWVHPINLNRPVFGEFHHLFNELKDDQERFTQYTRMSTDSFDCLLRLVRPSIEKSYCWTNCGTNQQHFHVTHVIFKTTVIILFTRRHCRIHMQFELCASACESNSVNGRGKRKRKAAAVLKPLPLCRFAALMWTPL